MPSFLSKVFGRKKHDDQDGVPRASDVSLLEGKFEAVSPTVSPTATHFAESLGKEKEKEKDRLFGIPRSKSRPSLNPSVPPQQNPVGDLPHLTLNLPGSKDAASARSLDVVFEADPDSQIMLAGEELGERRLDPLEALNLVKSCSQVITARGLETLGIMHPHWYSASPDVQRKLISLYIQSLDPKKTTTLSPASPSDLTVFESELSFTRSPHDIAAVLRWGLRHLKLDGTSFGKDSAEWSWYTKFSQAERQSSYPANAYSETLAPQVVPAHLNLLSATLEILSSLAAHAEANSISGSKLSKFLGFWLLCAQRSDPKDDWPKFYARWERAGRILEHLFLARIRDEALGLRMPTRLMELVQHYPYTKGALSDEFLARPKFTTRQYDALFVRIETDVARLPADRAKLHPLRLIAEALRAQPSSSNSADDATWEKIKSAAVTEAEDDQVPLDGRSTPSRVFSDETVRFLSLLPTETPVKHETTNKFTLLPSSQHKSSEGDDKLLNGNAVASAAASAERQAKSSVTTVTSSPPPPQPKVDVVVTDWTQFASAGFHDSPPIPQILAGTFLDKDVEKTVSAVPRKPGKKRKAVSPARSRRSMEGDKTTAAESTHVPAAEETKPASRSTVVTIVQLDEAFVDFWSDALLDPIASTWPNFVICKLKNPVSSSSGGGGGESAERPIDWLVIEHVYKQTLAAAATAAPTEQVEGSPSQVSKRARPSSPKPSFRSDLSASRMSSTLAATKKRFSFFTSGRASISSDGERTGRGRKKAGKAPKVGEMGEILAEEEEKPAEKGAPVKPTTLAVPTTAKAVVVEAERESVKPEVTVAAASASAGAGAVVAAVASEPKVDAPPPPTPPKINVEEIQKPGNGRVATVEQSAALPEAKNDIKTKVPDDHAPQSVSLPAEPTEPKTAEAVVSATDDVPKSDEPITGPVAESEPAAVAEEPQVPDDHTVLEQKDTPPADVSQDEPAVVSSTPPVVEVPVEDVATEVPQESVPEPVEVPQAELKTEPTVPESIPPVDLPVEVVVEPSKPEETESTPNGHEATPTAVVDVEADDKPEPEPEPEAEEIAVKSGSDDIPVEEHTLSEAIPTVEAEIPQEGLDPVQTHEAEPESKSDAV